MKMINEELSEGLDQPILIKGDIGLFQLSNGSFVFMQKGKGVIEKLKSEPSLDFLMELEKDGFEDPFDDVDEED